VEEAPVIMEPGDERVAAARGRGRLRASHADREQVIEVLKVAFVQGRLTRDELDSRVGQAFASRTYAELAALTADIPVEPIPVPPSRPNRARPGRSANATVKTGARVIIAATVLTAGVWAGAFFSQADSAAVGTLIWAFTFAWLGIVLLVGAVMLESSRQNRSGGQLPPGPGQRRPGLRGQPGSSGDNPALPGARADQTRADQTRADQTRADQTRADQTRADQTRADLGTNRPERARRYPSGRGRRPPRGIRPVPGAA
jgi:Domain of unknown function (DUF1707)